MFKLFLVLFITIPLIEIAILIKIGSIIGAGYTIALVIGTAFLGVSLLRIQGISTFAKVQANIAKGQLPATELIEGLILLISGVLLLTPGFFTDMIGILLLIRPLREALLKRYLIIYSAKTKSNSGKKSVIDVDHTNHND